jgi:hypothetical protein
MSIRHVVDRGTPNVILSVTLFFGLFDREMKTQTKDIAQTDEKVERKILETSLDPGNVGLVGIHTARQALLRQPLLEPGPGHSLSDLPLQFRHRSLCHLPRAFFAVYHI